MDESTVILVESQVSTATKLASQFLMGDPERGGKLQLLRQGEGIVVTPENSVC